MDSELAKLEARNPAAKAHSAAGELGQPARVAATIIAPNTVSYIVYFCLKYLLNIIINIIDRLKNINDEAPSHISEAVSYLLSDIAATRSGLAISRDKQPSYDRRDQRYSETRVSSNSSKSSQESILNESFEHDSATHIELEYNNLNPCKSKQGSNSNWLKVSSIDSVILIILLLNVATSCYGFGLIEYNNNLADYNYPVDSRSYLNPYHQLQSSVWSRPVRNAQNDGSLIVNNAHLLMSTQPAGSLNLDSSSSDQSNGQHLPQAHSWTSILNPFLGGGGGSNNNNPPSHNDSLDRHVRRILVPRVSGTAGNVEVRNYIVDTLSANNYHTELDEFETSTPVGMVKFANIIASSNPKACRQLVLACHYDSKMMNGFLGAIDSAVPCAMLLRIAENFNGSFRAQNSGVASEDGPGLRFIFFDGEEAFVQWTKTDSLYGSRHLAAKWSIQSAPEECQKNNNNKRTTELDRIELFVLLDLIGTSDTTFAQYSPAVRHHYEALQRYEKDHITRLRPNLSQLQIRRESAFKSRTLGLDFVEDDHVPFKQRGVPILLLLAHPFPRVWHTVADNYEAIDFARTRRILHVMEEFVGNYSSS